TPEAGTPQKADSTPTPPTASEESFAWPDWDVQVGSIAFQDNHLVYQSGVKPEDLTAFNPDYINLRDFTLKVDNIELSQNKELNAELAAFSFQEASGLRLGQLGFALAVDQQHLSIENVDVAFGNSSLAANFSTRYQSIYAFINHPETSTLMVDLSHFSLDLNDAFQFQPDVTSNEYLHELSRKKVTGSVEAKGSMEQMDLSRFLVKWGENTQFNMQGQFKNLMDPDSLWMDMDQFHFQTLRADLAGLIPEVSLGISIPDSIALDSQVHGSLNNLKAQTQLVTSDG